MFCFLTLKKSRLDTKLHTFSNFEDLRDTGIFTQDLIRFLSSKRKKKERLIYKLVKMS